MKTKLTIAHDGFHGLRTESVVVEGRPGQRVQLSASQVKKLSRAACGITECRCGESLLAACERDGSTPESVFIAIPTEGTSITVKGNYPQRR